MKKIKIISWNVNGIRASYKKGLLEFIKNENPDILCLQETKIQENQLPFYLTHINNYHSYFSSAQKKGYSGTALYTKIKPSKINIGFGIKKYDDEGRSIIAEYDKFTLCNVYFPNGKASKQRLNYKMSFYKDFLHFTNTLQKQKKEIIVCGDLNTAHKEIDLARPKENSKVSGFLAKERAWIDSFLQSGFMDAFRSKNQNPQQYTWWSMRTKARERNVGWRIDYFYLTNNLKKNLKSASILSQTMGSDHCPIEISITI